MSERMPDHITDDLDHDEWCEKELGSRIDAMKDYYYDDEILAKMEEIDEDR